MKLLKKIATTAMALMLSAAVVGGVSAGKSNTAFAEDVIEMKPIFSHHMVLQREKKVEIYGTTTPNTTVSVEFNGQTKTGTSGEDGSFSVYLDEMQANATGGRLVVKAGSAKRTFEDVLVGEVFYGSGQSNMAYPFDEHTYAESVIKNDPSFGGGGDYEKYNSQPSYLDNYKSYKKYHLLRFYMQKMMPETNGIVNKGVQNTWIDIEGIYDLDYVSLTAVAFAIHMSEKLGDVPVGVAVAAAGGTRVHEWISKKSTAEIYPGNGDSSLAQRYEGMLVPMGRFTYRATLWYQGESDVYGDLEVYRKAYTRWTEEIRAFMKNEDMPIITFQLPQFEDVYCKGLWPAFRQLQEELAAEVENTYYVCNIDLGDHTNIHPLAKWEICERAAGLALKFVYGKEYGGSGSYGQNPTVGGLYRKTGAKTVYMRFNNATEISVSEGVTRGLRATTNGQSFADIESFRQEDKTTVAFDTKLKYISYLQNNIFAYDTAFIYNEYGLPVAPFVGVPVTAYDHDVTVELEGCKTDGFERYFAMSGDTVSFKITPDADAELISLTVNGEDVDFGDGTVTVENISADTAIVCKFKSDEPQNPPVDSGDNSTDSGSEDDGSNNSGSTNPSASGDASTSSSSNTAGGEKPSGGCGGFAGVQSALALTLLGIGTCIFNKKR